MDASVLALVSQLARYLRVHPAASDSVTGMRLWWLEDGMGVTEMQMSAALEWMMQRGLVERTVAADGRVRYSRLASAEQLAKVESMLGGGGVPQARS